MWWIEHLHKSNYWSCHVRTLNFKTELLLFAHYPQSCQIGLNHRNLPKAPEHQYRLEFTVCSHHWPKQTFRWVPQAPLLFVFRLQLPGNKANALTYFPHQLINKMGPHAKHRRRKGWCAIFYQCPSCTHLSLRFLVQSLYSFEKWISLLHV